MKIKLNALQVGMIIGGILDIACVIGAIYALATYPILAYIVGGLWASWLFGAAIALCRPKLFANLRSLQDQPYHRFPRTTRQLLFFGLAAGMWFYPSILLKFYDHVFYVQHLANEQYASAN